MKVLFFIKNNLVNFIKIIWFMECPSSIFIFFTFKHTFLLISFLPFHTTFWLSSLVRSSHFLILLTVGKISSYILKIVPGHFQVRDWFPSTYCFSGCIIPFFYNKPIGENFFGALSVTGINQHHLERSVKIKFKSQVDKV